MRTDRITPGRKAKAKTGPNEERFSDGALGSTSEHRDSGQIGEWKTRDAQGRLVNATTHDSN